jgi:hypothetical protein
MLLRLDPVGGKMALGLRSSGGLSGIELQLNEAEINKLTTYSIKHALHW